MVILKNVVKTYQTPQGAINALDGIDLHVNRGEFVLVCGPSGSGKTTLLMTIAAMSSPTAGSVAVGGRAFGGMNGREREEFRAQTIGFVFQMFHLVPYLNVLENVLLAGRRVPANDLRGRAVELLEGLEMRERIYHRPAELSAGEKQRTAIARALMNDPDLLLADEPTGNLDSENARAVWGYLSELNQKGHTVIVATHEKEAEKSANRIVTLERGKLV